MPGYEKSFYEKIDTMSRDFPVIFHLNRLYADKNSSFASHWHEKIEFLYFVKGHGTIICNTNKLDAYPGVLAVVNSNELHTGCCISPCLEYYCIIVDDSLFRGGYTGVCEAKYINPIYQNRILFKNRIENDIEINKCMNSIIEEYEKAEIGFELSVKSYLFRLLVLLLRNHAELVLDPREYDTRVRHLNSLNNILLYIENNFNEDITIDKLCSMANFSKYYFCHLFKEITGKSVGDYVNLIRINKAEAMLRSSRINVTEAAMACGFNDVNYFARVFKKYKNRTPSQLKKETDTQENSLRS